MNLPELDALAEPLRQRPAKSGADYGFAFVEGRAATVGDVASIERQ